MNNVFATFISRLSSLFGRQLTPATAVPATTYFFSTNNPQTQSHNGSTGFTHNTRKPSFNFKRHGKNIGMAVAAIAVLVIVVVAFQRIATGRAASGATTILPAQGSQQEAKASLELNKEFQFPLRDQDGKEVSKLKVELLNAQLRDEIVVRGRRATALKNRDFLVVNIKITNDFNRTVQISLRDYMRLSVNGSNEKFAPEIHNDPVEVQAISTKVTRVGFPINESDKDILLQVGEINGDKETIRLDFNQ